MSQSESSSRFPFLSLHVELMDQDPLTCEFDIEALVDTGFDGGLAVPADVIPSEMMSVGDSVWSLADGATLSVSSYLCYVSIGTLPAVPTAVITLGEDALLGRHVTDRFRLIFDHGTSIVVEP